MQSSLRSSFRLSLLAAALGASLLAACGGGDGGDDSAPTAPAVQSIGDPVAGADGRSASHAITLTAAPQVPLTLPIKFNGEHGTPSFSDGVTYDATAGTLTVPPGVDHFTVTYTLPYADSGSTPSASISIGSINTHRIPVLIAPANRYVGTWRFVKEAVPNTCVVNTQPIADVPETRSFRLMLQFTKTGWDSLSLKWIYRHYTSTDCTGPTLATTETTFYGTLEPWRIVGSKQVDGVLADKVMQGSTQPRVARVEPSPVGGPLALMRQGIGHPTDAEGYAEHFLPDYLMQQVD